MAEKKLSNDELDRVGLKSIEIDWSNQRKLTTLFHHYAEPKEPLPASGVNDQGDATPNLCLLARLGKIIQGKQVFKNIYARELLNKAIETSGIEDLSKKAEKAETQMVRKHLQSSVDQARRNASDTDQKLKSALVKVAALTDENQRQADEIATLKAQLAIADSKAGAAERRVILGDHLERNSLKRVF